MSREELENRNIRQIDEALNLTPGVIHLRSKGASDNDFGLGLRGFAGRGGQSRTLVLLDGQPMNNSYFGSVNWSTFAPEEMERVEMARGPFSSLYGGNAMGGVVNLITRPVNRRQLDLSGQYGNRDTMMYSIRGGDRFFNRLGVSAGYSRYQTGGYSPQQILRSATSGATGTFVTGVQRWLTPTGGTTYQVGERGANWFNQHALRLRGEYAFSPGVFATFQYMRQSRSDGYDAYTSSLRSTNGAAFDSGAALFDDFGVPRALTVTPANFIGTPTGATQNTYQAQVLATLSPAWSLRVAGGVNYSPSDWYVTPSASATLSGGPGNYVNQVNRGAHGNAQATHSANGQNLIFGAETRHDRASIAGRTIPNYAIREGGSPYESQALGKAFNQAEYIQFQKSFSDNLNIVAGGRWDYWRTYDGANRTGITQPLFNYPQRSTQALTGKVAAVYRLPGNWQVRGSVGNAFRNPTIYDLYRDLVLSGVFYLANPEVQPERLFAYEAGLQRFFSGGHSVDATYYENRVSDLIYRTTDFEADRSGRIRRLTNAGLGRTRGMEFSARQRIFSWIHLHLSYTLADAVITENPSLPATVGKHLPYVPKHSLSYLASAAKGRWGATWSGRYVGAVYSTDTNTDVVRGVPGSWNPFFETGVAINYALTPRVAVFVNADNLLDRRYYLYFMTPGRAVLGGFRIKL